MAPRSKKSRVISQANRPTFKKIDFDQKVRFLSYETVDEIDLYKIVHDGNRNVFRFILRLSNNKSIKSDLVKIQLSHTRLIPSEVKKEVWKRDKGRCVICGETKNLHFDHDLPFSRGGTSLSVKNVRLLCLKHNLSKFNKIE